jgi:hypothetical protein
MTGGLRRGLYIVGLATTAVGLSIPAASTAGTEVAAAALGFGPNIQVDAPLGTQGNGDNEPAITVDQTGTAYINWQLAALLPSPVVTTADGLHFTKPVEPDPITSTHQIQFGDVAWATTSYPRVGQATPITAVGQSGVFHTQLGQGLCGAIEIRVAPSSDQGRTWAPQDATCQPAQVDRPWIAAYTPPQYRGTADALKHTQLYTEHHDFGISNIWVTSSQDGGATWNLVPINAEQAGSPAQLTSICNTIPGGIAVDQRGPHAGRVYAVWEASDPIYFNTEGCNYTQAQPFDHIFVSYSDDGGQTWTSSTVFNDVCSPNPPAPPTYSVIPGIPPLVASTCQDVSELFSSIAVDDGGNVYVAFISRGQSVGTPEYDAYVSVSSDGGAHWNGSNTSSAGPPRKVNTTTGTHYMPWIAAGKDGAIDVAFYGTAEVAQPSTINNKPQQTSPAATWQVYLAQSFDHGASFTQAQVSNAPAGIYFGDICSTGVFCGNAPPTSNWANDRTLYDVFGVAIGPDGAARLTWTDARDTIKAGCMPGPNSDPTCEGGPGGLTHVFFACQTQGLTLYGAALSGTCPTAVSSPAFAPRIPTTVLPNTAASLATPGGRWWPRGMVVAGLALVALAVWTWRRQQTLR